MASPTPNTTDLPLSLQEEIVALAAELKNIGLSDTDALLQQIMARLTIKDRTPEFESRVRGFLAALGRVPDKEDIECAEILSDEAALNQWIRDLYKTISRAPSGGGGGREAGEKGGAGSTQPGKEA